MKIIKVGDVYGVYKVKNKSNKYTTRGSRCYECICTLCGRERTFSESYLKKLAQYKQCICDKQQQIHELEREYSYMKKNYGNINICCYCKYMFKCPKFMFNAIDKRYMKKYYIERITARGKKRNIIMVLECDRFEFDWGNFKK